jgi:hypothetical protein
MNEQAAMSKVLQQMERVRQHYTMAPQVFLDAWKEGVKMAGPRLFTAERGYIKPQQVDDAQDKWQLIPDLAAIRHYTSTCSVSEGVFIGALVTFYNNELGAEILERFCYSGIGGIANRLELAQVEVITRLMLNHTGW